VPSSLDDVDKKIALQVARNLIAMLSSVQKQTSQEKVVVSPLISGYQWIASGVGDFSVATYLVEVKCTSRHFSSADYRQVLMYWILSYLCAIEGDIAEWTHAILMNPRYGRILTLSFNELVQLLGGGRSKVDLVELFASLIDDHKFHR
jgi:hypothetical protein